MFTLDNIENISLEEIKDMCEVLKMISRPVHWEILKVLYSHYANNYYNDHLDSVETYLTRIALASEIYKGRKKSGINIEERIQSKDLKFLENQGLIEVIHTNPKLYRIKTERFRETDATVEDVRRIMLFYNNSNRYI